MSELVPLFFILMMVAGGWILFKIPRPPRIKAISAVVMVVAVPSMFIGPVIQRPHNEFASLQLAIGLSALFWGAVAMAIGWFMARLWTKRRGD
jgi:predicted permease